MKLLSKSYNKTRNTKPLFSVRKTLNLKLFFPPPPLTTFFIIINSSSLQQQQQTMSSKTEPRVSGAQRFTPHLPNDPNDEPLRELFSHHINSFDHFVEYGLEKALMSIKPVEVVDPSTQLKLRNILLFLH